MTTTTTAYVADVHHTADDAAIEERTRWKHGRYDAPIVKAEARNIDSEARGYSDLRHAMAQCSVRAMVTARIQDWADAPSDLDVY